VSHQPPSRRTPSGRQLAIAAVADSYALPDAAQRIRLMSSFGRRGRFGIFADRVARMFDWPLAQAVAELAKLEGAPAWGPSPLPGAETIPVVAGPRYAGAMALFARFQPGLGFPQHMHPAGEITFVLEGAFRDASGVQVGRGDELVLGDGSQHAFEVTPEASCIAAVIAFKGIEIVGA
jgi:hypothetical protein